MMADSASSPGENPAASISACCVSFQLSFVTTVMSGSVQLQHRISQRIGQSKVT